MLDIIKLLLPVIIQLLPSLFNKPKPAMVDWFEKGKDAALSEKRPLVAFWMGSLECAFSDMTDQQYGDIKAGVIAVGQAAAAMGKGGVV